MIVTNHQIRNVLRVYTSRLIQANTAASRSMSIRKPFTGAVDGYPQGKRQALIERFTKAVVGRIIRNDRWLQNGGPIEQRMETENGNDAMIPRRHELEFAYNVIEQDARKTVNRLSMADPQKLFDRL